MAPRFILVMRHAEKPADEANPDLAPSGRVRAEKLATYIPQTFGALDFIVAAADSKHSARPQETVQPLSRATGIPIDATIADHDYPRLASDLLTKNHYAARRILVCWHHEHIPPLMQALGAKNGDYPDPWDPTVFNLILRLDYPGGGGPPNVIRITEPF